MSGGTWAIIPAKPLREAKSRLEPMLSHRERIQLALGMLQLVLAAVRSAEGLAGWAVLSRDEKILSHARFLGGESVPEQDGGLNHALEQAAIWCAARDADAMLVLHADLPLLQTREIESMLRGDEGQNSVVLAPSLDGTGTNAMLVRPPGLLRFSFGSGSLARHLRAAQALGIAPRLFYAPGTARDVDTPADLLRWQNSGRATSSSAPSKALTAGPSVL